MSTAEPTAHHAAPAAGTRGPVIVQVTEEHHIARAQQAAKGLARAVGLGRTATFEVATSVSELAGNLILHAARGGRITLLALARKGETGMEVTAEDEGPGIADVELAMQDSFTTKGGLGCGLPGVRRLMDEFEITSAVGVGTRVVARKWQPCR